METIDVAVATEMKGAHLGEFFSSLAETPEVAHVAIADVSGESLAEAREILGDKLTGEYRSIAKLLAKTQAKLLLVSMEPRNTPAVIDAGLEAGCHVLTEKPACVRVEDFAPLVRKAQSKHLQVMLALANRPHAPVQEARRIVNQGLLGKLYGVNMHLVADQARLKRPDYRDSWRGSKARAGGGHLAWLGIHWLDMAMYVTGLRVERVAGFYDVVGGQPIDVEDSAAVSLKFSDGVLGTMLSGFYLDKAYKENVKRYHSHMQIWGEDGWLRLSTFEEEPLEWYSSRAADKPVVQTFEYPKGLRSYQPFVRAAVRFSAGLAAPPITSEEGLHVLQTIFAFYKAADAGAAQEVR
ncbi:MAG: Gfo/Idh/MocA family oxidoreductase [Pirellulaceae bacterium]